VEDLSKHKMESEEIFIDEKNAQIINNAVEANREFVLSEQRQ
jgi:S-adenosylmethionine:tRNA ribosyltransferase-isomerase